MHSTAEDYPDDELPIGRPARPLFRRSIHNNDHRRGPSCQRLPPPPLRYQSRSLSAHDDMDQPMAAEQRPHRLLPTTPVRIIAPKKTESVRFSDGTSLNNGLLSDVNVQQIRRRFHETNLGSDQRLRSPSPVRLDTRPMGNERSLLFQRDTLFSGSFDSTTNRLGVCRVDSTEEESPQDSLSHADSTGTIGTKRIPKAVRANSTATTNSSPRGSTKMNAKRRNNRGGISSSAQSIINFCIENAKGDVATRVISRMANKREDFERYLSSLTSEQTAEFISGLRDYFSSVVQNLNSAEKIREISVQYGADQVPRRAWGFKADYFAVMAGALTTECVFLDGAQHQPTEAIEAWAELAELMFSNIRDGYYQRIRFLRKSSHCFNTMFSQSSDVSSEDVPAVLPHRQPSPGPSSSMCP